MELVWDSQGVGELTRDVLGGKGYNLMRLREAALQLGTFEVPPFFIVPTDYQAYAVCCIGNTRFEFDEQDVRQAFDELRTPIIVRSSSVMEDGIEASCAGIFTSVPNVNDYSALELACARVKSSAVGKAVELYAQRMGIEYDCRMAIIVQQQVVDPLIRGTIQIEGNQAVIEYRYCNGEEARVEHDSNILEFILDEERKQGVLKPSMEPRDFISESDLYLLHSAARHARQLLGMEGTTQVEFAFTPGQNPYFFQIRELPRRINPQAALDLTIPDNSLSIVSEVCNGIAGELALPAYVTFSRSGLAILLIQTGHDAIFGLPQDERADRFMEHSRIPSNYDFMNFREMRMNGRMLMCMVISDPGEGIGREIAKYEQFWRLGNSLFPEYILVCDKLDETVAAMSRLTTGKRGIVTCNEAKKTSHAMTVARDLNIPAFGVHADMLDFQGFFHQVETGDIVHFKSDGKVAVAYIEKKRERDPYEGLAH